MTTSTAARLTPAQDVAASRRWRGGIAAVLDRARHGGRLSVDEIVLLLAARGNDLARVMAAAAEARDAGLLAAGRPGVVTYSRKVFVPLTTLCRDRCHYCAFVDTPGQLTRLGKPLFMSAEAVLAVARHGAAMGCKEALLTLGDRPERRWPEAARWLAGRGFTSTLEYVAHIARLITAETGLLVHLNPGVMSAEELRMLRPTAPSMGMMLETTSRRLHEERGQVHYGSPDKDPALRLRVIEDAGRLLIPFTTGLLIGIGETVRDRAESLVALRDAHARHGHIQEVIVQNFRAKPRTAMRDAGDAPTDEYLAAVAAARLTMGPSMRIQAPPNLSDRADLGALIRAGVDDWGGVSPLTADHVNPERPWPHVDELADKTAELGFALTERLTVHPEFVRAGDQWIDRALHDAVHLLCEASTGSAEPGLTRPGVARHVPPGPRHLRRAAVARVAELAAGEPRALSAEEWIVLLTATGADLDAVAATADEVRRYTVGEAVSIVANRNLTSSGLRSAPPRLETEFTIEDAGAIAADAWDLGATELCVEGRIADHEDPESYLRLASAVKVAAPRMHLHAFRPQDIWDLAERGRIGLDAALDRLIAAGVDSIPGSGVKVLTERVRTLVAPSDIPVEQWIEAITAAHRRGIRSSSAMLYGSVETAAERIAHLRILREIQDRTGGFTEFVAMPLTGSLGGRPLVKGRVPVDEQRAMVAVARLMLSGSIPHIQIPWTRVGRETAAVLLRSGGDDLGGTLIGGRVPPAADVEHGHRLPFSEAAALTGRLLRPLRQRTTDYREPDPDRRVTWR